MAASPNSSTRTCYQSAVREGQSLHILEQIDVLYIRTNAKTQYALPRYTQVLITMLNIINVEFILGEIFFIPSMHVAKMQ